MEAVDCAALHSERAPGRVPSEHTPRRFGSAPLAPYATVGATLGSISCRVLPDRAISRGEAPLCE